MLKNHFRTLLSRKYQISLAILIPFSLVLFVAGPFSVVISAVQSTAARVVQSGAATPQDLLKVLSIMNLVLWVSLGVALLTGLVLSYSILSPIKKFLQDPAAVPDQGEAGKEEDFGILGRDFSQMMNSLGRHASILSGMSGGVVAFDKNGLVTAVNPSAEKIFACRSQDMLGKTLANCGLTVKSSELERFILDGLRRGRSYSSVEARISARDGRQLVLAITTSLLKGPDGKPSGLVANFMDLTSLRRMHEDLQRQLRLAGLGRLAAGVAHEVRNPLGAIKGMAQLIQEGLPDSDPRKKYGNVIEEETDRLDLVVQDLLSLAQGASEKALCDVGAILRQARELSVYGLGGKHAQVLEEGEKTPEIMGERGRLVQAFLNIFLNAFEAVPEGGTVRVRASRLPEDNAVVVEIGNTGPPLSPEVKARVFEPFFTTKEKGSGLGLAIAHQIITAHGGAITAESTERETVFRVVLPVEEATA